MITVAVAVNGGDGVNGKGSRRAVRWAMDHLLPLANRFLLVHVMPPVSSIPTPCGELIPLEEVEERVVELYVKEVKSKFEGVFVPYKKILRSKTRTVETLVLEGENPAISLLEIVAQSQINSLVLGSCSPNYLSRKMRGPGVPTTVLNSASEMCDIYVVFRHKTVRKSANLSLVATETNSLHRITEEYCGGGLGSLSRRNYEAVSLPDSNFSEDDVLSVAANRYSPTSSMQSDQSDVQEEIDKLRLELQNIISMNKRACEDLGLIENKVELLSSECLEEQRRLNAALQREETMMKVAAEERARYLQAVKDVEEAKDLLSKETRERKEAEMNAAKESSEKQQIFNSLLLSDRRYKRYTKEEIELATNHFSDKMVIGEGGYGKVYKCNLDHTPVAVKVLQADAVHKREECFREIEVLSQFRHPHLVLLLGACPESGCLVYEFLENGSLDDSIFHRNGKPPLPWFMRFRIIFEVACGLAFLHNSKPDPIVHRDLKPGNILLDRNYVSKISDVGLAKLVSDVVPDNVTEYNDSMLAGTLHYMDPEYQRTGTIRPKSDLYAFGIIVLQILTARRPNGLLWTVENAIKDDSFAEILDKSIADWPLKETKELAQIAVACSELRCRDRPDLDTEVLPSLRRLVDVAEASTKIERNNIYAPSHYFCPILKEIMDEPYIAADGFTYELRAIKAWLERHNVSPVTKLKLQNSALTPNHAVYSAIQEWRSQVKF